MPKKKSFLTRLGLVRQYNSPKPYCSLVLQLSYREIFIFLNIPGKDLTGSLHSFIMSLTAPRNRVYIWL